MEIYRRTVENDLVPYRLLITYQYVAETVFIDVLNFEDAFLF